MLYNRPFLNVFSFIKFYTNSFGFGAFAFHNNTCICNEPFKAIHNNHNRLKSSQEFHNYFLQSLRCSHNPTNQKDCWTAKKNSQNLINIFFFPFKVMAIMASYYFFIYKNVKEFKQKSI